MPLGGGGTARAETVRIARRGVLNVLRHAGIVAGDVDRQPTRWLDMPSSDCFSFAEEGGMIETMADLGEPVEKGAVIAASMTSAARGASPGMFGQDCRASWQPAISPAW